MKVLKLHNGGVYYITDDLWNGYTTKKSAEMFESFCRWCNENRSLMDSGARILAARTKEEWADTLSRRMKTEAVFHC